MRQSWQTMTSVSAGHIIQTSTQPVGSGRPQRESNPGPPHQESRALPQSYRAPLHALKEVRTVIGEPKSPFEEKILREIAYTDDVDFVGLEYIDIDAVQVTLHRYNLKVNIEKNRKKHH